MNKTKKLFKHSALQKKIITGSLACTLLLGGAIPSALAAEEISTATPAASQQQTGVLDLLVQKRLQSAAMEAAVLAGKDSAKVQQDVIGGQSIAEASGISSSTLLSSMLPAFKESILLAAHSLLTDDQIAKLLEEGRQKLTEALTTPGYFNDDAVTKVENELTSKIDAVVRSSGYASEDSASGLQAVVAKRMATIIDDAVEASDLSLTDVLVQLELGSTLADATGMDTADLMIQLQQLVDEDIDNAASANGTDAATVEETKANAAKLIEKLVTENVWISSEQA